MIRLRNNLKLEDFLICCEEEVTVCHTLPKQPKWRSLEKTFPANRSPVLFLTKHPHHLTMAAKPLTRETSYDATIHRISSDLITGYAETVYEGKQEQMTHVRQWCEEKGFIPKELVANEVAWFYGNLGIDDSKLLLA
jgi:hypothetical protein